MPQDSRLAALEDEFTTELKALDKEFQVERSEIVAKHLADTTELRAVVRAVADEEADKMTDLKQDFETTMEESRTRNVEMVNSLAAALDLTIEVRGVWCAVLL